MRYALRNNAVLCIHNLSGLPREVNFSLTNDEAEACVLVNLLADKHSQPVKGDKHHILLETHGYRWLSVCGLGYLLKRRPTRRN
jgi:maltose alpha-D-glucosyltransferase / alpha-amylase